MIDFIAPLLLFVAFILLLLVSVSLPIIKSVYLFGLAASVSVSEAGFTAAAVGSVKFGNWGYCMSAINYNFQGVTRTAKAAQCSKAHLGYTIDSTVANALGVTSIENALSKDVTKALVIHPIVCGFAFVAFLTSLCMLRRRTSGGTDRIASVITLFLGFTAAVLTTIVFLIDAIGVAVVRKHIKNDSDGQITLSYGNAVWMTLAAAICLWLSMIGACGGIFARRRQIKAATY